MHSSHRIRCATAVTVAALALGTMVASDERGEAGQDTLPVAMAPGAAQPLLDMVVAWLTSNFDLPASFDHPALAVASPERLALMRYGPDAPYDPGEVVALYKEDERTIYLGEAWDGRTPADLSVIVHEMVHHLQSREGMRFACAGEREILAYRAQEEWLALFGQSLAEDFQIDPVTLMLRTTCAY